ncbi:DUF3833 family protein [Hohaiivirga grylli]
MSHSLRAILSYLVLSIFIVSAKASDFTLEGYFKGKTYATGTFSAINGVKRNFTVTLHGRWRHETLTLREDFVFGDGTRETKTWRFRKIEPGLYLGTREDVVGETVVRIEGHKARFSYLVNLSPDNQVRFHDTMVLNGDGTIENTAWVTKYGFPVARTRVNFTRL